MNLLDLPEELIKLIDSYLSFNDSKSLFFVDKKLSLILRKNQVLHIKPDSNWKRINLRLQHSSHHKTIVSKEPEFFAIDYDYHNVIIQNVERVEF
jgi:hypothetical protein